MLKKTENAGIKVVGIVDGPTSVFIASKIDWRKIAAPLMVVILIIIGFIVILKRESKIGMEN